MYAKNIKSGQCPSFFFINTYLVNDLENCTEKNICLKLPNYLEMHDKIVPFSNNSHFLGFLLKKS